MDSKEVAERALAARLNSKLDWYEREIEKRHASFVQILKELRDDTSKPYLAKYANFDEYMEKRWGMTPRRAQQLLAADSLKQYLLYADPSLKGIVEDMNEGQMREVAKVPESKRAEVVKEAAKAPKMTARSIREARSRVVDAEVVSETPTAKQEPDLEPAKSYCPHCGEPLN